jgi:hypothetical protein
MEAAIGSDDEGGLTWTLTVAESLYKLRFEKQCMRACWRIAESANLLDKRLSLSASKVLGNQYVQTHTICLLFRTPIARRQKKLTYVMAFS